MIYVVVLSLIALLISSFVPTGAILIWSITFAVVILNYRKTLHINKNLQEIRSHLGLMGKEEAEDFQVEAELNRVNQLTEQEMKEMNQEIEQQFEQEFEKPQEKKGDIPGEKDK
ncbi:hypothetical protein [Paenibacillus algorifonticola]|uniref:hypothetical protein n=1 Tax=Paenibacillus algorifonticola TaxID=684063 RepID=UPI00061942D8|nr:hypothetical protein [Paenibacillus algorifonticola]